MLIHKNFIFFYSKTFKEHLILNETEANNLTGKISIISAGLILDEAKKEVLLIKRTDSMWGDAWSIPGGHIEYGETVEEALLRELKEELDVKAVKTEFLGYEEFEVSTKPNIQFISFNFVVIAKKDFKPNHEIKEAKWFPISELDNIKHKIPEKGKVYLDSLEKENL